MDGWIIINVEGEDYDRKLSELRRPSFLHGTRDQAEVECLRLAKANPDGEFVIFAAVAMAVPTRTNPEVFLIQEFQPQPV